LNIQAAGDAPSVKPPISFQHVSLHFGGNPVLEDVSLDINSGDFLAVLGPNGSGKTTLLKTALGLITPTKGKAMIFGVPAARFRRRYRIGYVPQKAGVFGDFPATVWEVVTTGRISRSGFLRPFSSQDRQIITDVLQRLGLEHLAARTVRSLSGGQRQRVAIARALVAEPEVLLLDEAAEGLDAPGEDAFYNLLAELNRDRGLTVVLVTHDIGAVSLRVRTVICLNRRVVFSGSPQECLENGKLAALYGMPVFVPSKWAGGREMQKPESERAY
jgi:zinc transport system ATP-binding protein